MNAALIADLSGLPAVFQYTGRGYSLHTQEQDACTLHAIHHHFCDLAAGQPPVVAVFGKRLVSPTRFGCTFQFQTSVRNTMHHTIHLTSKDDAREIGDQAIPVQDNRPFPTLRAPTYIAFASPATGFGVYTATAISRSDTWSLFSCLGTYGGVVGKNRELLSSTEAYRFDGELRKAPPKRSTERKEASRPMPAKTSPENGGYVKQCS